MRRSNWRNRFGGERKAAKLTEEDVLEIRRRLAKGGESQAKIGASFGVSDTVISSIKRGLTWSDVQLKSEGE